MTKQILGRPLWEIIAWVIIIGIILWAIIGESKEARCYDGRDDCDEIFAWDPEPGDTPTDLIRRLEFANGAEELIISRRLVMITAAGLALLLMWYFRGKVIPNIIEYIVTFVFVMGVLWFSFRYHDSHYLYEITRRADLTLQELKYQLDIAKRPTNI